MVRPTLVVALLTAAAAHAQSQLVLPASHATVDGSTSTNVPFGRSTAVRVQCAYDSMLFSGPGTITQLAFRMDANVTGAAKAVDCEVHLSTMAVPLVAIAPLLIIWFGPGLLSKVLICALIVFFPVLINTVVGLRAVPQNLRDLMRSMHATPAQMLRHLELPAALPVLLGGLRVDRKSTRLNSSHRT